MVDDHEIIRNLSATPSEFRTTAECTGHALLKKFSEDSGLEKEVARGFDIYEIKFLKKDLENLTTQLKKHVCSTRPKRKEGLHNLRQSRYQDMASNGMSCASSPSMCQERSKIRQKIFGYCL